MARAAIKARTKTKQSSPVVVSSGSSNGTWLPRRLRKHPLQAALFIVAIAIMGTIALILTRAATPIPSGQLKLGNSGYCLDDNTGLQRPGNKVQLWKCSKNPNPPAQHWDFFANGTVHLNANAGYCLDDQYSGKTAGSVVWLYTCNGTPAQVWKIKQTYSNGTVSLMNPSSGLCLDNNMSKQADGNKIQLWSCNNSAAQQWTLPPATVATPSPAPKPTVTLSAAPTTVTSGSASTLTWSSTNSTNCTASGAWSGGRATSGTASTGGLNANATYTLTCTGAGGSAAATAGVAITTTSTETGPSGVAMPVGDISGWHQIFADNFTNENVPLGSVAQNGDFPGSAASRWSAYPAGWPDTQMKNSGQGGTYNPTKDISIANGLMDVYLHTENGIHYVSVPEPKIPGATGKEGGMLYGRYAVRFRADAVPGYKTAFLLWPDSENWPTDGEIDFPEGALNDTIGAYMHPENGQSDASDQSAYVTSTAYTDWHTAVIEWLPSRVTFILDGKTIGNATSRIPNTPMHWVLQIETAGVPSNSASGHVQIAWATVYKPTN